MAAMRTLFGILFSLASISSFACADLKNKPAYFKHAKIECGTLVNKIVAPKLVVGGKTYPFAMDASDDWGECPNPNEFCSRQLINMKQRGNAFCRAYGMGPYAKSNSYSPLFHYSHETPDVMARLKRVGGTTFAPAVFRMNHSRAEHFEVREIWCHKNYQKR